ncbi:Uncharacterised protein r2_g3223 [Pycnogonum litorale]
MLRTVRWLEHVAEEDQRARRRLMIRCGEQPKQESFIHLPTYKLCTAGIATPILFGEDDYGDAILIDIALKDAATRDCPRDGDKNRQQATIVLAPEHISTIFPTKKNSSKKAMRLLPRFQNTGIDKSIYKNVQNARGYSKCL